MPLKTHSSNYYFFIHNLIYSFIPLWHIYAAYNITRRYSILDVHTYTSGCRRIHVELSFRELPATVTGRKLSYKNSAYKLLLSF
jgi:hypothetical protein